ncbi:hypothetical protein LTR97_009301 [Elasticomyces elasticus]|uniref:Secondary thiamine-phosphate synthase enzyme n=1 Tax=Elasticomyces elasticus TaxID=574655 RepID=A0AAN7W5H7_9PEZI|nr:hypothetical protein LTR97_009301 [Elasticomyces elasticus]
MPFDTNIRNTTIFLVIFILAFFPSLFHVILKPVLYPLELLTGISSEPRRILLPTCGCCPPPSCYPPPAIAPAPQKIQGEMAWAQKQFTLPSKGRGSHLITDHVLQQLPEIKNYKVGMLNLFVQHTSCALSLNENYDSDVRADMSEALDRLAPEDKKGDLYRHSAEGLDDMPAHIKSALVGASVTIPITEGRLATGTWQGIWYLEFRNGRQSRKVVATIQGEKKA